MGFKINVLFGKNVYRYHVEVLDGTYLVKGKNGTVEINEFGQLVKGELQAYYVNCIFKAITEYLHPGNQAKKRKDQGKPTDWGKPLP